VARWRRRLAWWARQNRLGVWLLALVVILALAYGMVILMEAARTYVFPDYEPKDIQRQQQWEREQGTGR
jgi:hypothetical protein